MISSGQDRNAPMINVPDDRRPPLTPQLALRVALIGSFALAMFAIVFFRLWFLQVLSGDKYLAQAKVNRVRDVDIPAPRGEMVDRSGNVLVSSKRATGVEISPADLPVQITPANVGKPPQPDAALYDRLAQVLGIRSKRERCVINGVGRVRVSKIACLVAQGYVKLSYGNVTIATDVPYPVLAYLSERQAEFPGVQIQPVWIRTYPYKTLAAAVFGTVGPLSCISTTNCEVHEARFRGLPATSIVGQSGLEWYYNHYLQGTDGYSQVQVDALGHFTGTVGAHQPVEGHDLRLSLDVNLQRVGEQALATAVNTIPNAFGGAFVALNPVSGEVYAMGSNPSFNPDIFANPAGVPESTYNQLNNPASNYPLLNRATQSAGPTGSTFKPITATAALQSGAWSVGDVFDDTGQYCFSGQCRHNAGHATYGVLDLTQAIKFSSDDFFYNLGTLTNNPAPDGGALQHWAHLYGIGRPTGIDLGGEVAGRLPTPRWREAIDKVELRCEKKHHVPSCGIADGRLWSVGDNENLAVGQGDVGVTPLQLAVVYSAIANGGTVVRPHLGLDVQTQDGTVLQRIAPSAARHLPINPLYLETIRQGLREAASQAGGTSFSVMGNFPEQVYGKTGTAQYNNQPDYSWYACFVPPTATSKPIVVVVTVARAGFGVQAAAPVARQILSQWFLGKPGTFVGGTGGGAL